MVRWVDLRARYETSASLSESETSFGLTWLWCTSGSPFHSTRWFGLRLVPVVPAVAIALRVAGSRFL